MPVSDRQQSGQPPGALHELEKLPRLKIASASRPDGCMIVFGNAATNSSALTQSGTRTIGSDNKIEAIEPFRLCLQAIIRLVLSGDLLIIANGDSAGNATVKENFE